MSAALVAERYAKALLDIGIKEDQLPSLHAALQSVADLVRQHDDLSRLVSMPLIAPSKKATAFDAVLAQAEVSPLVRRFFKVVAEAGRLALLFPIVEAFDRLMDAHLGRINVAVSSARPLNAAQSQRLAEVLGKRMGKQVQLIFKQEPALLGGLKVQVGSTVLDASLQGQLQQLEAQMLGQ